MWLMVSACVTAPLIESILPYLLYRLDSVTWMMTVIEVRSQATERETLSVQRTIKETQKGQGASFNIELMSGMSSPSEYQ